MGCTNLSITGEGMRSKCGMGVNDRTKHSHPAAGTTKCAHLQIFVAQGFREINLMIVGMMGSG